MRSSNFNGPCEHEDCDNQADMMVFNREDGQVHIYCDYHGELALDHRDPEYIDCCPNCGCYIPVN